MNSEANNSKFRDNLTIQSSIEKYFRVILDLNCIYMHDSRHMFLKYKHNVYIKRRCLIVYHIKHMVKTQRALFLNIFLQTHQ